MRLWCWSCVSLQLSGIANMYLGKTTTTVEIARFHNSIFNVQYFKTTRNNPLDLWIFRVYCSICSFNKCNWRSNLIGTFVVVFCCTVLFGMILNGVNINRIVWNSVAMMCRTKFKHEVRRVYKFEPVWIWPIETLEKNGFHVCDLRGVHSMCLSVILMSNLLS